MTDGNTQTACLTRCLAAASVMADGDRVEVEHLLLAATFNDDEDCRSRLVMKQLGAHHFFTDEAYQQAAEAFVDGPKSDTQWTPEAAAVLGRLAYWKTRTGDHTADTAHLLLACVEQEPATLAIAGVTPRDAVRAAITVRHRVSPADRQPSDRGPILSPRRRNRPRSYQFTVRRKADAGPSKARHFGFRSQTANTAGLSAPIQFHITQLHVVTFIVLSVVSSLMLIAIAHAAITVTWWALLWLAGQSGRRARLPVAARVAVDVVLVVVSVPLGLPWWLAVLAVPHRALDVVEGRLGLLEVRGESADPLLSEKNVRADRRVNVKAGRFFAALKLRRELSTR
ncbi:hypothetical protein [Amycolatopsis sp. NPDC051102]|uniref:hypothetical protein n=1 Tax=Amycolatopsis sp. NPDC051102 TaxID=3155163 RepID=UPI0034213C92